MVYQNLLLNRLTILVLWMTTVSVIFNDVVENEKECIHIGTLELRIRSVVHIETLELRIRRATMELDNLFDKRFNHHHTEYC